MVKGTRNNSAKIIVQLDFSEWFENRVLNKTGKEAEEQRTFACLEMKLLMDLMY